MGYPLLLFGYLDTFSCSIEMNPKKSLQLINNFSSVMFKDIKRKSSVYV